MSRDPLNILAYIFCLLLIGWLIITVMGAIF